MTTEKVEKLKKKKWIQVLAPNSFKNEVIGELYAFEAKSLIGRSVTVNLMTLTRDIKKQNTNLRFVITKIEGSRGITELFGYYLIAASTRRLVRKGKKRMDLSFTCQTSDNKKIRIKPLFILPTKTKSSTSADLRKTAISYLLKYLPKMTFDDLIKELINHKLQRSLKDELKKVYPIRISEVAALHIEKEKKPVEEKAHEMEEKKE